MGKRDHAPTSSVPWATVWALYTYTYYLVRLFMVQSVTVAQSPVHNCLSITVTSYINHTLLSTLIISIINHTLLSTIIRAVISTLTYTSMANNGMSDSECYLAVQVQVRVLLLP